MKFSPASAARLTLLFVVGASTSAVVSAQDNAPALESEQQKYSYMLGMEVGRSLQRTGLEIDVETFSRALQTILDGGEPQLSAEEASLLQGQLMQKMQQQAASQASAAGGENKEKGEAYLAENAGKDGVQTTDSGLQYEVLEDSDGDKPTAADQVTVHYRGTLLDGTEFDSSYSRGEPATFPLNGVIPGWTEGLQLMPVGSKYRFVIPSQLAYGERGAGGQIGPHSTLIFEVELLEIKK